MRVAAAVLVRPDGQVLLAQRPAGKPYEGYWEFPGGKLEPGESPRAALVRELHEELGITVRRAAPWLVQEFVYPHAHVELHFFRVFAWDGELHGRDGQAFAWQTPGRFTVAPLLPAKATVSAAQIDARFDAVALALKPFRRGDGFVLYTTLTPAQTRSIAQTIDAVAEPLSQVAEFVVA